MVVEHLPWSEGKRPVTLTMMCWLARWARRLSWRETARAVHTRWECGYRSGEWFVQWGLAPRQLEGVPALGGDEIPGGPGQRAENFLTVSYPIDRHCRRLLWVGRRRTQAPWRRGLAALGAEGVGGLRFVCRDMWKAYLKVLAAQAGPALRGLDRFHLTLHLNPAVDAVRRAESGRWRGRPLAQQLKPRRWKRRRRGNRVRGRAQQRLCGRRRAGLATGRAWRLQETFRDFWRDRALSWARAFLSGGTERALRSRSEPMRKVARRLRSPEERILNGFRAQGEISAGAVEGRHNKIRVVTRRSYGFRTYEAMEIALYPT